MLPSCGESLRKIAVGHRFAVSNHCLVRPCADGHDRRAPAKGSQRQGRIPRAVANDSQPQAAYTEGAMTRLHRITQDPDVMGGRPCIRGLRVTVGTIVGLLAAGHDADEVLAAYPYLERDDIRQALAYAAWRSEEQEVTVGSN